MPTLHCAVKGCDQTTETPMADGWRHYVWGPGEGNGHYCPEHAAALESQHVHLFDEQRKDLLQLVDGVNESLRDLQMALGEYADQWRANFQSMQQLNGPGWGERAEAVAFHHLISKLERKISEVDAAARDIRDMERDLEKGDL